MELEFNRCPPIDSELRAWAVMYPEIKDVLLTDPATYEKGEQACFEWKAEKLAKIHEIILSEDKTASQVEYAFPVADIIQIMDNYAGGSWIPEAPAKLKERRENHISKTITDVREHEEKERLYINNKIRNWADYEVPAVEKGYYRIGGPGVFRVCITINEETGEQQYTTKDVCRTPFILCGISEPLNGDNIYYKVRYPTYSGEIKEFWASQSTLLSRKELKTLFLSKGINCPENLLLVETIDYISRCIAEFSPRLKKEFSAKRNGWTEDKSSFVLGDRSITSRGIFPILSICDGKGFPELEKKGTVKEWADGVKDLLEYDVIRFKCYDSMTAPLKSVLGVESHVTDHYGNTSQGKTFSSWIALSMIGDPEGLTIGAKSTAKGILVHIRDFSDLPILIDESSDAGEHLSDLVYPLTSNKGRVKSTVDGQRDGGEEYHTSTMFTGEKPIRDCLQNSGQQYRVNELDDTLPDLPTKEINRVKRAIRDNHGHIIEMYIQEVFKRLENGTLHTLYDECFDKLPENSTNIEGRSRSIFACIMVAGEILEYVFRKVGMPERNPDEIVNKYFEKCILEKPVELEYIRALRVALDWVNSEYGRFEQYNEEFEDSTINDKNKRYGYVDSQYIDIIGTEFTKKMKDEGFSPSKLKEDWYKQGICDSNDKDRVGTYRFADRTNPKKRIVGVRIFRSVAEELAGVSDKKENTPLPQDAKIKFVMETLKWLTEKKEAADINLLRLITEVAELDELLNLLAKNGKVLKIDQTSYKWIK